MDTFSSYQIATRDLPTTLNRVAAQPLPAREIAYYSETIQNIKTVDEFLADDRVFNFAMKAFGLGDMSYAKAFMKKVLNEGIQADDSFANSLSDPRYREFATVFNFADFDTATTSFARANEGTIDRYIRQTLEEQAGEANNGVRLALYFERKAPEIDSYYAILADEAIATVVRTAFGIPREIAFSDIDKQVEIIAGRLDLEDLTDPEKLDELLQRFTSLWDVENGGETQASSPSTILLGTAPSFGVSADTMLQIQQLKR